MEIKDMGVAGVIVIVIVLVVASFYGLTSDNTNNAIVGNVAADVENSGDVQEVTLRFINYEYVMDPPTLEVGVPVIMTVDLSTVYGCMRYVQIPEWGISKYVKEGDNVIEFTPTTTGSHTVTCSMGMGVGEIIVE